MKFSRILPSPPKFLIKSITYTLLFLNFSACEVSNSNLSQSSININKSTLAKERQYEQECNNGNGRSCFLLGYLYESGNVVSTNYEKAFKFFEKGCYYGDTDSCSMMGSMYKDGKGVAKSCVKALEIYDRNCNKENNALACGYIAISFEHGVCVSKDLSTAAKYAEKSCRLGSQVSCKSLEEIKSKMSR